jgi:hypothetical protein
MTSTSISTATLKSNTDSNFFSIDIDKFLKEYGKNLKLGIMGNAFITKLLGRMTVTKKGINLDDSRYDTQDNMASYLGCSVSSIGRIESKLVDLGLLAKKTIRHPKNPFRLIRILTLSKKLKRAIVNYVKSKKANNSRDCQNEKPGTSKVSNEVNPISPKANTQSKGGMTINYLLGLTGDNGTREDIKLGLKGKRGHEYEKAWLFIRDKLLGIR